jgi:glycosyltransferase involved in cell wall biosynthesis
VAEHLVDNGHEVTVATTKLTNRESLVHNGVNIVEFNVIGNYIRGMSGEVKEYQDFLTTEKFDALMVKAAQQWTFDALIPVLDSISYRKIHIPCGYPGLYKPEYAKYYQLMPEVLHKFDHLIFYSKEYRDIKFAFENGFTKNTIIPNGASKREFGRKPTDFLRSELGIDENDFVFLSVGSITGGKGHKDILKGFELLDTKKSCTLILNGNRPPHSPNETFITQLRIHSRKGLLSTAKWLVLKFMQSIKILTKSRSLEGIVKDIHKKQSNKKVLIRDLPRSKVVQTFFESDLFVFASHSEYSPLVLFEAAAAGLPFLSVPVGNAAEIAKWTKAGKICTAESNEYGMIVPDPAKLAVDMKYLMENPEELSRMSTQGRKQWSENFFWDKIVPQYEKVLTHE